MKEKTKYQKAAKCILNRVQFHAPVVFDSNVDPRILLDYGVDVSKPIFKFEKILTKPLVRAFELASQSADFNLLIPRQSVGKIRIKNLKKIKNLIVYDPQFCPHHFVEMVNKLNINYASSANYDVAFKDKFFKVCGRVLNPHFDDFSLRQTDVLDDFFVEYHEFLLNGCNYFLKIQNAGKQQKSAEIEFNLPLERGYYYFKRLNKCVKIENLLTKEVFYFNFLASGAKFRFSQVEGLENSTFCCVNVKVRVALKPTEQNFVFFNFGSGRFSLRGLQEIKSFEEIARNKCYEIFNVRVCSKNPKFDQFFNHTLPQKIWCNWAASEQNLELEEKYLNLKRLFVRGDGKLELVNFREIGLREVGIFNGLYFKKIVVVEGEEKFLRIGRTFFYNISAVSQTSLKSVEPLCVCFGR